MKVRHSASALSLAMLAVILLLQSSTAQAFHYHHGSMVALSTSSNTTNNTGCPTTNVYGDVVTTCVSSELDDCPLASTCTTCDCLQSVMLCIEVATSTNAVLRSSCSHASDLYVEMLSVTSGNPFDESSLGASCRTLACRQSLNCSCDTLPSDPSTPTSAPDTPGTPVPALPQTPAPATPATPAPISGTPTPSNTSSNETDTVQMISVTVAGTVEDFNIYEFSGLLATAMGIELEQVVVVDVTSGSVIVKFYFASVQGGKSQAQLTNMFVSQIAIGDNVLTQKFNILSVTVQVEDISTATPLPEASPTPAPTNSTPDGGDPPTEGDATSDTGLMTVVIIIICVGVFVVMVLAGVGFCCFRRWKAKQLADKNSPEDDVEMPEHYQV